MLARCFGGGLFFDILSLSSSCTCTYMSICMYVCACVYLGRLPLAPPSLLSLSLFLSYTQLLSSFARSPLHLPPSRPFALDPSVKPTALSVSLSLSLLRIHSVSFSFLLTAESPFYHLAEQQLVATSSSSGRNKGVLCVLREPHEESTWRSRQISRESFTDLSW